MGNEFKRASHNHSEWRIWLFFCFFHQHFARKVISEQLGFFSEKHYNILDLSLILKTFINKFEPKNLKKHYLPNFSRCSIPEGTEASERVLLTIRQACHRFLAHHFISFFNIQLIFWEREGNIDLLFHTFMHSFAASSMCPGWGLNLTTLVYREDTSRASF